MRAGEPLGSYVIVRELGSGGMGTVYLAEHTALGRQAAIKVLQPELTSNQLMLTRFFNEARAASAIKSPGIVEIYDFGRHVDGSAYIVMELLEGEPLAARLARMKRLPLGNALVIARQIASALAPAHRAGIVHRDLKPDNVFLVPDAEVAGGERVKLLDFGIAKLLGDDEPGGAGKLTTTKTVMGTPHYMSPEQCRGAGGVDARSDLYALGCMLHELISGNPPFVGEGAGDLIGAHIYLRPRRLTESMPEVPVEVDELVQRLLAKQAAQRPQSAEDVAAALSALASRFSASYSAPTLVPQGNRPATTANALNAVNAGTPMAMVMSDRPRPTAQTQQRERNKSRAAVVAIAALVVAAIIYAVVSTGSPDGSQQFGQSPKAPEEEVTAADVVDAVHVAVVTPDAAIAVVTPDAAKDVVAPDAAHVAVVTPDAAHVAVVADAAPSQPQPLAPDARTPPPVDQDAAKRKRREYVASKTAQARHAVKNGKCDELRSLYSSVLAYDTRAAEEILRMPCTPPINCNDRTVQAAAQQQFDSIQETRISDPKMTVRLVENALANKCLASKKSILVRIGIVAACAEKLEAKVLLFFSKSKDGSLVHACPEFLADPVK